MAIAIISFYDLIIAQFIPNPLILPRLVEIPTRLGLSWQTWMVILFGLVLIFLFEGAHQQIKRLTETKQVSLSNRENLFGAMAEVKLASIEVSGNIEDLRKKQNPYIIFAPGRWQHLDRIQSRFHHACEDLLKEVFAAGNTFETVLRPLKLCVENADKLDSLAISQLEQILTETRNKIDEPSQTIPAKEGSKT